MVSGIARASVWSRRFRAVSVRATRVRGRAAIQDIFARDSISGESSSADASEVSSLVDAICVFVAIVHTIVAFVYVCTHSVRIKRVSRAASALKWTYGINARFLIINFTSIETRFFTFVNIETSGGAISKIEISGVALALESGHKVITVWVRKSVTSSSFGAFVNVRTASLTVWLVSVNALASVRAFSIDTCL
jgi:hypothetical protein